MLAFISGIGLPELLIVLAIIVLLFGAKRIPQLFQAIGDSAKSIRDATSDDQN